MSRSSTRLAESRRIATGGLLALAVALSAVWAGCGGSSDSGQGAVPQGTTVREQASTADVPEVTWAFPGDPLDTVAPQVGNYVAGISLSENIGQGLMAYDPQGNVQTALASSWRMVSPTVYTYKLRRGARFSNGNPVTVEDVLYSVRALIDPKTGGGLAGLFVNVKSVDAVGDQITMTLKQPDANAAYFMAYYAMLVWEKATTIRNKSTPAQPRGIPIGSGPYKIAQVGADHVTLVRNSYYRGEQPKAAKVVVRFISDDATRLAALEAGDVDGTFLVPPTESPQWQRASSVNLLSAPGQLYITSRFNLHKKPFDDVHARRALMYAFNREAVVKKVLHGNARVANTLVAPEFWKNEGLSAADVEARTGELGQQYPFDLDKAKAELAKSKYPDGFSTSVTYSNSLPEVGLALQILAQDLKKVGVELKLRELSDAQMLPQFTAANPDYTFLVHLGGVDYPSPISILYQQLCSCTAPPNGGFNTGYDNPELNKMIDEAAREPDTATRADKVMKVLAIGNRDIPAPTLWWSDAIAAVNKKFVLADYGPWSVLQTPWMTDIYAAAGQ